MDAMVIEKSLSSTPFASRAMMDILISGLKLHHLSYRGVTFQHNMAKVPLSTKREFLKSVAHEHGLEVIVKLGRGAALHLDQPIGRALVPLGSVSALCARWQRLERYVHANHYTDIELNDQHMLIQHLSRTVEAPSLLEDLAVLGLMCALIAQSGASDIVLWGGEGLDQCLYRYTGNVVDLTGLTHCKRWKISWKKSSSGASILPFDADRRLTWEARTRKAIESVGLLDCTLEKVSKQQCLSTRSLQRHLGREGVKFAQLVQDVRVNQAANLILENTSCLAEIGFLCGFSDQAHFTRVFTQWNGMSPKAYFTLSRSTQEQI